MADLATWGAALRGVHPGYKLLLYIQLLSLAIWGPLSSVVGGALGAFGLLAWWRDQDGLVVGPYMSLAVCAFAVVVVLPGGTKEELVYTAELATRILFVMLGSSVFGLWLSSADVVRTVRLCGVSGQVASVVGGVSRFIPIAVRTMKSVLLAQRSRGFEITWTSAVRLNAYEAILVPYLMGFLRSANLVWISINVRPYVDGRSGNSKASEHWLGVSLVALTCLLWF